MKGRKVKGQDGMAEFIAVVALAVVFAVVVGVVVLRFTSVLTQMNRAYSLDRSEVMREIDASHVQAFANAMSALEVVQQRVSEGQAGMFERTMDMVHGPVQANGDGKGEYATDNPNLDMRPAWKPNDDGEDTLLYADATDDDDWVGLGAMVVQDNGPRAVSVRPGEGLVPGG